VTAFGVYTHLVSTQAMLGLVTFVLFCVLVLALAFGLLGVNAAFAESRPLIATLVSPFECGVELASFARAPFSLPFLMVVVLFVLFDVELVVLVVFGAHSVFMAQSFVLFCWGGLLYEWWRDKLSWNARKMFFIAGLSNLRVWAFDLVAPPFKWHLTFRPRFVSRLTGLILPFASGRDSLLRFAFHETLRAFGPFSSRNTVCPTPRKMSHSMAPRFCFQLL